MSHTALEAFGQKHTSFSLSFSLLRTHLMMNIIMVFALIIFAAYLIVAACDLILMGLTYVVVRTAKKLLPKQTSKIERWMAEQILPKDNL